MKQAMFQYPKEQQQVQCSLCSHRCLIAEGKRGICAVRENQGGILYTLVYDKIIARNIDPIEKKPLFHFHPGSLSYSIATPGCNFRCRHCQNADISQLPRDQGGMVLGEEFTPEQIVRSARGRRCASISYTYTEPTIYFELAYDTARLAAEVGLRNVFVTNGYITPEALETIRPYLHGANIDLKGFSDNFYRKVCGARLEPVLDAIRLYKQFGIWIEITTLVIPGHNDSDSQLRDIARFIVSLGKDIPWHVSRFHPTYKLTDQPSTPLETLRRAREIGLEEGLRYVYEGNIPGEGEDTACWSCGRTLVKRTGFHVEENRVKEGKCSYCGVLMDGVWD
ncbi:MAG: AmmeMemoRadiSam system radical SAM enzyme [Nitrospirae bacterium GWD2_57_8]|nr:MAG: AmmeMemoRadiSam system radical SAM enzyme [Nitrospirae bacterium GWD2_57_8]